MTNTGNSRFPYLLEPRAAATMKAIFNGGTTQPAPDESIPALIDRIATRSAHTQSRPRIGYDEVVVAIALNDLADACALPVTSLLALLEAVDLDTDAGRAHLTALLSLRPTDEEARAWASALPAPAQVATLTALRAPVPAADRRPR